MATSTKQVSERDSVDQAPARRARANEALLRAPVDIFEDGESLVLTADMPGVSKERLNVRVEGNTLLLEGDVRFDLPEKVEAAYADVRSSGYRRSFVLSRELDTEKIEANLKDGVLSVRIPKHAAMRPRRIEVQGP